MKPNEIEFKNYQSIADAKIELADGITVLIGPSDSGKSAFFRGTRDFWYNSSGDGFVTAGAKKATVQKGNVRWEKGKTINRYVVDENVFDGVGRGVVPPEAIKQTRIREVEFGEGIKRRLNIAEQFGIPFMIGERGSDNAKIIGSLSGIGIVFNALREATGDHNRARKEQESAKKEIEKAEERIQQYGYLDEVSKLLEDVTTKLEAVQQKQLLVSNIKKLLARAKEQAEMARKAKAVIERCKSISEISFDKHDKLRTELHEIQGLDQRYKAVCVEAKNVKEKTLKLRRIGEIEFSGVDEVRDRLEKLRALEANVVAFKGKWKAAQDEQKTKSEAYEAATGELEEVVNGMDLCPFSGIQMPEKCKEALKR